LECGNLLPLFDLPSKVLEERFELMKAEPRRKPLPFPFIIDELESLRPTVRNIFGFTHVYLEDKLLFSLRDVPTQRGSNGMWLIRRRNT